MITYYMPICNHMRKISARHVIITNVTDLTFIKSIIIFIAKSSPNVRIPTQIKLSDHHYMFRICFHVNFMFQDSN